LQVFSGLLRLGQVVNFRRPISLNPKIDLLLQNNKDKIAALLSRTKTALPQPLHFVTMKPEEIVQQCSLTMQYLFMRIPSDEFLSHHYSDAVKCPNIIILSKFKDRVSQPVLVFPSSTVSQSPPSDSFHSSNPIS
jgi:hypothetical protein